MGFPLALGVILMGAALFALRSKGEPWAALLALPGWALLAGAGGVIALLLGGRALDNARRWPGLPSTQQSSRTEDPDPPDPEHG